MKAPHDNESLWKRLHRAELLEEFCALMFDAQERYEDLLEWLEKNHISSSLGALSRFSDSHRSQWTLERAQRQYESLLSDEGSTLDEARRRVVAERVYALAASPHVSERALLKLRDQEIRLAQLEHDREKLAMLERRLKILEEQHSAARAAIEKADTPSDGGMTEETLKLVREALGMTT